MIGICLCDILQSLGNITKLFMTWNIVYVIENPCNGGRKMLHLTVDIVAKSMQILTRRCSSFLALYMAVFRAVSLIFPFSKLARKLMSVKFTIFIMTIMGIAFGSWAYVHGFQVGFEKKLYCEGLYDPPRTSYMPYVTVSGEKWEIDFYFIDGCMALFVSISYIFVAIALLAALRNARKRRNSLGHVESTDKASGLIIVMAITVFISESSYALLYILQYFLISRYHEQPAYEQLDGLSLTLLIINSNIHSVLCFFLSSQYRNTVINQFCCKRTRVDPYNDRVGTSSHPSRLNS